MSTYSPVEVMGVTGFLDSLWRGSLREVEMFVPGRWPLFPIMELGGQEVP